MPTSLVRLMRALLVCALLGPPSFASAAETSDTLPAEDQLAIMQLIARYAQALDSGDLDGYVDNFTPGGTIEWANNRVQGQKEIRTWLAGLMKGGIGATPAQVRHFVNVPQITGSGTRATARTYVVIFGLNAKGAVNVPSVASYTDTVVKVGGRWLFEKRVMQADMGVFGRRED